MKSEILIEKPNDVEFECSKPRVDLFFAKFFNLLIIQINSTPFSEKRKVVRTSAGLGSPNGRTLRAAWPKFRPFGTVLW